jgi:hypothetical protein
MSGAETLRRARVYDDGANSPQVVHAARAYAKSGQREAVMVAIEGHRKLVSGKN